MKFDKNWKYKSLEILENQNFGESINGQSNLVIRCIELSKVPLNSFTLSDLRLMIGQGFGLQFLIPLAIEKLQDDIFIEADYFEGDLISNVLKIEITFWENNQELWKKLKNFIDDKRSKLEELKIDTTKFYTLKIL